MGTKETRAFLIGACLALAVLCTALAIRRFNRHDDTPQPKGIVAANVLRGESPSGGQYCSYVLDPPPMGGVPFEIRLWKRDMITFIDDSELGAALVEQIESEVSSWREESITHAVNSAPVGKKVKLSVHAAQVYESAVALHRVTKGVFNPTLGPLIRLWREAVRRQKAPTPEELDAVRTLCTINAFTFDAATMMCTKDVDGAQLDFGGVAKGYMVDQVAELMKLRGATEGIITAGGDLRVFGDSVSRKVGIQHPDRKHELYGYFYLRQGATATSGNYERAYTIGERSYGHILDPRTFAPTKGPLSATVMAADCTTADGLATAVYILGKDEGIALVESLQAVEALVLVRENGAISQYRTSGFPEVRDLNDVPPSPIGK